MLPLVKLFKVSNADCYFYDTNRNEIVQISPKFYDYLEEFFNGGLTSSSNVLLQKKFDEYKHHGYFSEHHPSVIEHPMSDYLEDILDDKIETITLQVTQNCNLRCQYCPYTGNYYTNRVHNDKKMSFAMAKKGVDFLASHSRYTNEVAISFYGGEPLLEIELISEVMAYAKSLFKHKELIFSITTNGTLMTDRIMQLLSENKVRLLFSLDGPESVHDVNRKYASGKGSFKDVLKNIKHLKDTFPDYFREFVAINTVMDNNVDIMQIDEFYSSEETFSGVLVQTTITNPAYVKEDTEDLLIRKDQKEIIDYEFGKYLYLLYKLKRISKNESRIFKNYFDDLEKTVRELTSAKSLPDKFHPSGPCIPGRKKLFMTVDGVFFPCERIDELSPVGQIGSIDTGIDIEKANALLNVGKITENQCKKCWAISQCKVCFIHADDGHTLNADKRLLRCQDVKENVLENFKDICLLKKYHYDFSGITESSK